MFPKSEYSKTNFQNLYNILYKSHDIHINSHQKDKCRQLEMY